MTRSGAVAAWLRAWREPVHRDGLALVLSTGTTGALGLVFWVLAARLFPADVVGVNSVAVSTMTLLSGLAQLNVSYLLLRFLPVTRRRPARLVLTAYGVTAATSLLAAGVFVLGARVWAPELVQRLGVAGLATFLLPGAVVWTVFALQDFVLTAMRRAVVVPGENAAFSALKLVLLLVLGGAGALGIAWAWLLATAVTVVVMNVYLFARVLPRTRPAPAVPDVGAGLGTYVAAEYAGSAGWNLAVFGLPVLVLQLVGAEQAAVYGTTWTIAFALYAVASGVGQSFVAHAAGAGGTTAAFRSVVRRALVVVGGPALLIVLAAPLVLRLFGPLYERTGVVTLVLATLSAVPNVLTNATVNMARIQRRAARVALIPIAIGVLTITGTVVLAPAFGVAGAAAAWLVGQSVVAALTTPWASLRRVSPARAAEGPSG